MMSNLTRRRLLVFGGANLVAAKVFTPALVSGAEPLVTMNGRAFGSGWAVALPSGSDLESLRTPLEAMLAEVDQTMSPWRSDSEISVFNSSSAGSRSVSSETALVAAAALDTAKASEGWFDPTVGPMVSKWGFGPIEGTDGMASPWEQLMANPGELGKSENHLTLDLCGIAKGRALDRMAEIIADSGYEDFLIDLGGEITGQGRHPEGRHWQVAVEDPRPEYESPVGGVQLDGRAIATSGLRAQSYQIGHMTYSHIIDPRDGIPVQSSTLSVSVLADDGMNADAWATALVAAGDEGPALAEGAGIAALFLKRRPMGLGRVTTGDFDRYLL